jgi:hypothetical protein
VTQLVLSKSIGCLCTPIAQVTPVAHILGQVLRLDMPSKISFVTEILFTSKTPPLSIHFDHVHGHIRGQGLSFACKTRRNKTPSATCDHDLEEGLVRGLVHLVLPPQVILHELFANEQLFADGTVAGVILLKVDGGIMPLGIA